MSLIYIIIAVAFIDTFSQLPIIAPFAISLGASPLLVGIIIGMYSLSNIAGNIFSGIWIDRIGAKKVLFLGMLAVGIIVFFYSLVINPYQLAFIRFAHGIAGGFIVPAAFTLLGTKAKRKSSGKTMAFSGASVGTAAIIGPALGAIISVRLGYEWLFFIVAFFMILFGFLALFFLNEKPIKKYEGMTGEPQEKFILSIKKPLLYAYLAIFLLLFSLGTLTFSLPLKIEELLINAQMTGVLFSTFGITAILFFLLPTNKLFDKQKKSLLMTLGLITISTALLFLAISFTMWHLVISMVVYGIGFAFLFPSASAVVIECSRESERGKAFGVFYACFSLGVVAGSFISGFLALAPSLLFLVSASIILTILFILSLFSKVFLRIN